jgi:hypothetical protein
LASILENWRQKIKFGDFFGSNIFGARATPAIYVIEQKSEELVSFCKSRGITPE